jgi:hypothetical protein
VTALLLFLALGRQWLLLPGLALEAIPGLGVLPFWLLVVGAIWALLHQFLNGTRTAPTNPSIAIENEAFRLFNVKKFALTGEKSHLASNLRSSKLSRPSPMCRSESVVSSRGVVYLFIVYGFIGSSIL